MTETVYLAAQRGFFKDLKITTHPTPEAAEAFGAKYGPEWAAHVIRDDNDPDLGGPALVSLYNAIGKGRPEHIDLKKFESRAIGKRRVYFVLDELYKHQPHEPHTPPAPGDTIQATTKPDEGAAPEGEEQESNDMAAKKKAKKAKTAKPAGEKKSRGKGKAAGKVADFRPVREGTDRQKVLKLMNGTSTAAQIAGELGFGEGGEKKVGTIVFCMSRDNGIGYEFGAKGQLKALYPGDKTYKDAVKKPSAE